LKKILLLICLIIGLIGGYLYNRRSFEPIRPVHLSKLCAVTALPLWAPLSKDEAREKLLDITRREIHPRLAHALSQNFKKLDSFKHFKEQFESPELKSFECPRLSSFFGEQK